MKSIKYFKKNKLNKTVKYLIKTQYPRCGILPHAGKLYAGDSRRNLLKFFPRTLIKYIIYISALHNTHGIAPGIYEMHKDKQFLKTPLLPKLPSLSRNEHSFTWVEEELREHFPGVQIYVITPVKSYDKNMIHWITQFIKKNKNSVLFSTTDLTHHGENYNNSLLSQPYRLSKQNREEKLIHSLIKYPLNLPEIKRLTQNNTLLCGPYAIQLFAECLDVLKLPGKVVDYCDSHLEKNMLDKYTIKNTNLTNLVSYVCVLYGSNIKSNDIYSFDVLYALGMIKSVLLKNLTNSFYTIKLPLWSPFYQLQQGVFVGSSLHKKTNCSYGRYQDNGRTSTAFKMIEAAGDCLEDARNRWKIPYSLKNIDDCNIKLEVLDPKAKWKKHPAKHLKRFFKMDGKQGIYLQLSNGKSATYLPVVAKENNHWTIDEYIESLSKKAGGEKKDWLNGTIWIYSSKTYIWDAQEKKLLS